MPFLSRISMKSRVPPKRKGSPPLKQDPQPPPTFQKTPDMTPTEFLKAYRPTHEYNKKNRK